MKTIDYQKTATLAAIFVVAIVTRIPMFDQVGKDIGAYTDAVVDFIDGKNPYSKTAQTFENIDDPGAHGFAYLPGFLYLNLYLFSFHLMSGFPFHIMQKMVVLAADIGIGLILVKQLYRKNFGALVFGLVFWYFNPYFVYKRNYVSYDSIPIFIMMLSLYFLEKDDVLAGTFYSLSIVFKTFPVLIFPIFLMKARDKIRFLAAGGLVGGFLSIPFLRDLKTYINGAILVHGKRGLQGRPFLFFVSYFYKIELFQIIPLRIYTYLAAFSGWALSPFLHSTKMVKDKYALSIIPFLAFYLFTPVLNRTYMIWFMPILILGWYEQVCAKNRYLYFGGLTFFWLFYYSYIYIWKDGFHVWKP